MSRDSPSLSDEVFAHSVLGQPLSLWETLHAHHAAVSDMAGRFGAEFGWDGVARLAGGLHDLGKASAQFQAYIRAETSNAGYSKGGDHSTSGARVAAARLGALGRLMAFGIAGHHAGLPDAADLDRRLDPMHPVPALFVSWQTTVVPGAADLMNLAWRPSDKHNGFGQVFLARMLFSCLVDADRLETERFYAETDGVAVPRGGLLPVATLLDRLRAHQAGMQTTDTPLNQLRTEVLDHAVTRAALPPGLFTLTVPTGGGKTLTSLRFALEHARAHGLRRVIYVIPYTSIIEQTATVFRHALSTEHDALEHHANFDWSAGVQESAEGAGDSPMARLRRASENWDMSIVVTTSVQFFESLYAAHPSRCRKLHNLARSVIVLDEAQTLPLRLLHPCMAALEELCLNYGATAVLCTATQPALRAQDGFPRGLDIPQEREIAPDPYGLYDRLRRVRVEILPETVDEAVVAERFGACRAMLCIVNRRDAAASLFGRIRHMEGAVHLTTLMCPRHRRAVLARVRRRLADGLPVRLVATSLIEAGVDVDFPEVWREQAGLDSVAQAAGRCNREGRLPALGRLVVFAPADGKPPSREVALLAEVAAGVFRRFEDPLSLDAVRDYFKDLYWTRGEAAFDAARLDGKLFPILREIADTAPGLRTPFETIARAFRLIDETMDAVVVPWRGEDGSDTRATDVLARIAAMPKARTDDLRVLQQYTVPIPRAARDYWLAKNVLKPAHPALGMGLLAFADLAHYDEQTGIRLDDLAYRSAETNFF